MSVFLAVLSALVLWHTCTANLHEPVCGIHVDIGQELGADTEYWNAYVRSAVERVNFIYRGKVPALRVESTRFISVGTYSTAEHFLAHYAGVPKPSGLCASVFIGNRRFPGSDVVGVAYVGSACRPGHAAVFNAERVAPLAHMENWIEINTGAWWHRDNAVVVLGHEMLHVYGLNHSDNPADIMYYQATISEMPQHVSFNSSASVPCLRQATLSDSRASDTVVFVSSHVLITIILFFKLSMWSLK